MFICQVTKKVSKPGEKQHKVVVESRKKEYFNKAGEKIAEGSEIVKEIVVSEEGLLMLGASK